MRSLEQIDSKVEQIDDRLNSHEGKVERILGEMSESLQKITEVMIKQKVQEDAQKIDREEINQLNDKYHELDKKADLAIQSEENIAKTADEIKGTLKAALKWGFGLFGSLMIVLVVAAIKAFAS